MEPCEVTIGALWLLHVTASGGMVSLVNDLRVIDEGCDWTNTKTLRMKITRIINKLRGGKERCRILEAPIADQRKLLNSMLREEYKSVPQKKKGSARCRQSDGARWPCGLGLRCWRRGRSGKPVPRCFHLQAADPSFVFISQSTTRRTLTGTEDAELAWFMS